MSTYYRERMEADLQEIQRKVRTVSELVEGQVELAVRALLDHDRSLASEVVVGDRQVNRRIRQIDDLCHAFIVRHAPSEEFLRRVSAVMRLDVALERIGDYADSIGREVGRLSSAPPEEVAADFGSLAVVARHELGAALTAFHEGDAEGARRSVEHDVPFEAIAKALEQAADSGDLSLQDAFGFLHVGNLLMRVLEQSENIREHTLFALFGETPAPRVFRVQFVDEQNAYASKLAEAYARSRYPKSGEFSSAGWSPASEVEPSVGTFLSERGLSVDTTPHGLSTRPGDHHHHVVVLMARDGRSHVEPVPFKTTLVVWDQEAADSVDSAYDAVTSRVDDLMLTLAGPEAA